jgi:NAD kinase
MTDLNLIRPAITAREGYFRLAERRVRLIYDETKPEAVRIAQVLRPFEHPQPHVIIVIGGDGTMLRAIRQHWQDNTPFLGINTGTLGFLLNKPDNLDFWDIPFRWYQLPLLSVDMLTPTGTHHAEIAFNDCWVERETGQTAWMEVSVNGEVRLPRMIADGMLVATAAGSTSYARAMGATPLPFNANLLTLAASCVLIPQFWQPAILPPDSSIRIRNLDPDKRPLRGFVDGISLGPVCEMTVQVKPESFVELLFIGDYDPVAKLAVLQFPKIM